MLSIVKTTKNKQTKHNKQTTTNNIKQQQTNSGPGLEVINFFHAQLNSRNFKCS